MSYLDEFQKKLGKRWKGSLVSVSEAGEVDANAKKYLSQLAKIGDVEKVTWGWYWIPDEYEDFLDFLAKDKHFKVLHKQTAAAWWSGDFVHRNYFAVAVKEASYGKALERFARSQGWNVSVETRDFKKGEYRRVDSLYVEALEETIVDCLKAWAFADAFSSLHANHEQIDSDRITRHYWERIPRTNTRVGQVLKYGGSLIGREGDRAYPPVRSYISDGFVRRQVEEAAERVIKLG